MARRVETGKYFLSLKLGSRPSREGGGILSKPGRSGEREHLLLFLLRWINRPELFSLLEPRSFLKKISLGQKERDLREPLPPSGKRKPSRKEQH